MTPCAWCGGFGATCDPGKYGEPDERTLQQCERCGGSGEEPESSPLAELKNEAAEEIRKLAEEA